MLAAGGGRGHVFISSVSLLSMTSFSLRKKVAKKFMLN